VPAVGDTFLLPSSCSNSSSWLIIATCTGSLCIAVRMFFSNNPCRSQWSYSAFFLSKIPTLPSACASAESDNWVSESTTTKYSLPSPYKLISCTSALFLVHSGQETMPWDKQTLWFRFSQNSCPTVLTALGTS